METWTVPAGALAGALAAGDVVAPPALGADEAPPLEQAAAIKPTMAIGAASRNHRALLDWFTGSTSSSAMWTPRRVLVCPVARHVTADQGG